MGSCVAIGRQDGNPAISQRDTDGGFEMRTPGDPGYLAVDRERPVTTPHPLSGPGSTVLLHVRFALDGVGVLVSLSRCLG